MDDINYVINFYSNYDEKNRLLRFPLERIRSQELISRYLTSSSLKILDVGGGAGVYSFWLSGLGHEVYLVDATPIHIEQAKENESKMNNKLAAIQVGDARNLDFEDQTFDLVLMMGPLYHLVNKQDRMNALAEAHRVLKKDGFLIGVCISRFASMMDGFQYNLIQDLEFIGIMNQDLIDGQHRSKEGKNYFTTSFFHSVEELKDEVLESGFELSGLFAIESFAGYIPDIQNKITKENYRNILFDTIRKIEQEPTLMGVSPHIMIVGNKR